MKERTSFEAFFAEPKPTPMEVLRWTTIPFDEWERKCNGHDSPAYSNLAPAMLSVAVIREQRLLQRIAELEASRPTPTDAVQWEGGE